RDDLGVLQAEVTGALAHFRVAWSPAGFGWEWDQASPGLDRVLWPVAWSAAELLVHGPLERIRECPGQDTCGWLFLDLSKNAGCLPAGQPRRLGWVAEPGAVAVLAEQPANVPQPPAQRYPRVGGWRPAPLLVVQAAHPPPETIPDVVEQPHEILTLPGHGPGL